MAGGNMNFQPCNILYLVMLCFSFLMIVRFPGYNRSDREPREWIQNN